MQSLHVACLAACVGGISARAYEPYALTYAAWSPPKGRITMLNTTWTVPSDPTIKQDPGGDGGAHPAWFYGILTMLRAPEMEGKQPLCQPALVWNYRNVPNWTMLNKVLFTEDDDEIESEAVVVHPGDKLVSSVYATGSRSYTMSITSTATGRSISTSFTHEDQPIEKTTAYFVLGSDSAYWLPDLCGDYPPEGEMSFEDVYIEVDGKQVKEPEWKAIREDGTKCDGETVIVDPATIKITWEGGKDNATPHNTTAVAKGTKSSAAKKQN